MTRYFRLLVVALCLMFGARAQAFTPESGFWWNPAEGGSGYTIEIQDNNLFLIAYLYQPSGAPLWLTAQGDLLGNSRFQSGASASDGSWLNSFSGGQCAGCVYRPPMSQLGSGGTLTINFVTERTGTLTYAGRTIPIQRFDYALTVTANDQRSDVMRGEWQIVMDFSSNANFAALPYYGDVVQFISVARTGTTHYFDGCRPANSETARCQASPPPLHSASGRLGSDGKHIIVVKDQVIGVNTYYLAYIVTVGTDQFDGKVVSYLYVNENSINIALANGPFYPVRGFRSASRTYVDTHTGPAVSDKALAATATAGLGARLANSGDGGSHGGMTGADVLAQHGYDPARYAATIMELTQRLQK